MKCQECGERPRQETMRHEGKTLRVCRQCGNGIRTIRRPKQAAAREKRRAAARAEREKPQDKEGS